MNATNIFSINPSKAPLGSLYPEAAASARVSTPEVVKSAPGYMKALRSFFGQVSGSRTNGILLAARVMFGGFLMASGILGMQAGISVESIAETAAGFLLLSGMLTRSVMALGMVWYAIQSISGIAEGAFPQTAILLTMACTIFFIAGAGTYSLDSAIYRAIRRHARIKAIRRERRKATAPITYKAYSNTLLGR